MNITFWNIPSSGLGLKPGKKFTGDLEFFATEYKACLLRM